MRKQLYELCKANGLCGECGNPKDEASMRFAKCFKCRVKAAERKRTYDKKVRTEVTSKLTFLEDI